MSQKSVCDAHFFHDSIKHNSPIELGNQGNAKGYLFCIRQKLSLLYSNETIYENNFIISQISRNVLRKKNVIFEVNLQFVKQNEEVQKSQICDTISIYDLKKANFPIQFVNLGNGEGYMVCICYKISQWYLKYNNFLNRTLT